MPEKVANAISGQLKRPRDFVARYGGEEFVVILPDTSTQGAIDIMQACRKAVEALQIKHETAPVMVI